MPQTPLIGNFGIRSIPTSTIVSSCYFLSWLEIRSLYFKRTGSRPLYRSLVDQQTTFLKGSPVGPLACKRMLICRWTGKDAFDFVERVTTADVYGQGGGASTTLGLSKVGRLPIDQTSAISGSRVHCICYRVRIVLDMSTHFLLVVRSTAGFQSVNLICSRATRTSSNDGVSECDHQWTRGCHRWHPGPVPRKICRCEPWLAMCCADTSAQPWGNKMQLEGAWGACLPGSIWFCYAFYRQPVPCWGRTCFFIDVAAVPAASPAACRCDCGWWWQSPLCYWICSLK